MPKSPTTVTAGEGTQPALPPRFELVCWNVHKERRPVDAELQRFAGDAELLLLQEAVSAELGDRYGTMVVAFERGRRQRPAGVATGSSAPPLASYALLSPAHEPVARTPKSALATLVRLQGSAPLLVVNVHGINFRRATALADQLAAIEPRVAAHSGPVIVAGDFNTWSRRRRAAVDRFAERLGLQRVDFGPRGPRLDLVLHRGLTVERAEVLQSRSSDHDALRVTFALSTARAGELRHG